MVKNFKPFGCYSFDWYGKAVYVGFLPKIIILYGEVENQHFDRALIENDKSLAAVIEAAVRFREGIVDKDILKTSLGSMYENYGIQMEDVNKITSIAAKCNCYADAFEKKLVANGIDSRIISELEYRKHRPELLETCECLIDFFGNKEQAFELF